MKGFVVRIPSANSSCMHTYILFYLAVQENTAMETKHTVN
jgi:hypothetical protein